jgi:hypothetical protein
MLLLFKGIVSDLKFFSSDIHWYLTLNMTVTHVRSCEKNIILFQISIIFAIITLNDML